MNFHFTKLFNTYSIVARDPETGYLGGAVQTHIAGVGRFIPVALPGVGVIVSQSLINISYNPVALAMLKEGIAPQKIIEGLTATDPSANRRQVAVINNDGEVAAFTGDGCIREFGHLVGDGYSVQANMMTRPTVIDAMREAYESATGDLAARMLVALQAAQAEDGDIRGMQSSALKVVSGERTAKEWETIYDIRVDEHHNPVEELARLVNICHAQRIDREGYDLLKQDKLDEALAKWTEARNIAPDQEQIAFWQATTLADANPDADAVSMAARIFNEAMAQEDRREHWLDLIQRIQENGIIERAGAGDELIQAIEQLDG